MREGWLGDDYLILFDEEEQAKATATYGIGNSLAGYTVLGLKGWDDLILRDSRGSVFTLPAVPQDTRYLQAWHLSVDDRLTSDARYAGKIKWYVTPLVFGGSPSNPENLAWITAEQHADLVVWWNGKYREALAQRSA